MESENNKHRVLKDTINKFWQKYPQENTLTHSAVFSLIWGWPHYGSAILFWKYVNQCIAPLDMPLQHLVFQAGLTSKY